MGVCRNNQGFVLRVPSSLVQQNGSFQPRQCYLSARLEIAAADPESEGFPVAHAHSLELSDTPPQVWTLLLCYLPAGLPPRHTVLAQSGADVCK